jgi:hypothetical protein
MVKSIILFPFRLIAFGIRLVLRIVTIPLIILFRIREVIAPEIFGPLRNGTNTLINIFRF